MNLTTFLEELSAQNIELFIENNQLRYRAPKGTLTPEFRSKIAQYKSEIVTLLKAPKAYPLSAGQRALWFLYQLAPKSPAYNIMQTIRFQSEIDIQLLQQAFETLIQRHSILRTTYIMQEDEPIQQVHHQSEIHFKVIDANNWCQEDLNKWIAREADRPFNLEQGPVIRLELLTHFSGTASPIMLLTVHHIAVDHKSFEILTQELNILYQASGKPNPLPPLKWQYQDYVRWETSMLSGPTGEKLWNYWQEKLSGELPLLNLPTDYPRPHKQSYQGDIYECEFEEALTLQIRQLCEKTGSTTYMLLLAVFQILLYRYTRQDEMLIGSPMLGRNRSELENLVGYFVNPIVLRAKLEGNLSFTELLHRVHYQVAETLDYQEYPFGQLVERLQIKRDASRSPLFQVVFVFDKDAKSTTDELRFEFIASGQRGSAFDLTLTLFDKGHSLQSHWNYNTDIFDKATIARMAAHFKILLKGVIDNPKQPVSQLPLLTETEQQQLIAWNKTETDYPSDKTIVDLFEARVLEHPESVAVVFEEQQLTYRELNGQANQLAHYLINLGIAAETLVGICVARSVEMVIGLLSILKAGGAYVPLDPNYPIARLQFMLEDTQVPVLLTQSDLLEQLPVLDAKVVCVDNQWEQIAAYSDENPMKQNGPENLAYVIYTSGSTGKPKGTLLTHKGLSNYLNWALKEYPLNQGIGVPVQSSLAFDATITSLYLPLISGNQVILLPEKQELESLAKTLQHIYPMSLIKITPAHLEILNQQLETAQYAQSTQALIIGGEALTTHTIRPWLTHSPQTRLINEYGPTESVVGCCIYDAKGQNQLLGQVPIGRPIANTQIYILDAYHNLTPLSVPGELCIAGSGLARGYLNRPDLTAEKFIEVELFGKRQRLYKTGDLARWLPDGNLEYLGRIDQQVKLRGFRIELGEIEATLVQHKAIKEVVVILYDLEKNPRLAAYVILSEKLKVKSEKSINIEESSLFTELRTWLKSHLPDYMVPAHFTVLDKLPLTPNGKVDRKALPKPNLNALSTSYQAPRTETEQCLVEVWSQILKQTKIGIFDNFFERGGDSILSIQMVARVRTQGLELSPHDVFEHQTIAELAQVVRLGTTTIVAEQGLITGSVSLTPIQHALFARQLAEPWHFNQAVLLAVPKHLNPVALQKALAIILEHHDALRLRVVKNKTEWQQWQATPNDEIPFHQEDLSEESAQTLKERINFWQASLNLEKGPLVRLVFFQLKTEARLFWCIHHLAVDGVSWRILLEDLQTAYYDALSNKSSSLPNKTSAFKTWAEHLNQWAKSDALSAQAKNWHELPKGNSLPIDNPDGNNQIADTQHYTITISAEVTKRLLTETPAAYHTQINDILLTALMLVLQTWTGYKKNLIDIESHGRATLFDDIDLSRTVGWFTSLYTKSLALPTETEETKETDLGLALKAIKEQLRQIPDDGIGYGVLRYLCQEDLPQGQILFNYLGQFDQSISESEWALAPEDSGRSHSLQNEREYLIEINGQIANACLSLTWSYSGEQYQAQTIQRLADNYQQQLQLLIEHCATHYGYTPSDFPLARLTQNPLEQIVNTYGNNLANIYPLSPMQQGMLFHTLYAPDSGVYFVQFHCGFTGDLKVEAFRQAWELIVERHSLLRTAFWIEGEKPLQLVCQQVSLPWQYLDWCDLSPSLHQQQLDTLLTTERQQGFELNQAPLIRLQLIRENEKQYRFVCHFHHLLMDGWCLPILFTELLEIYQAYQQGEKPSLPPVRPYQAYLSWLAQQDFTKAQSYWQEQLKGFSAPTPLPIGQSSIQPANYQSVNLILDASLNHQLESFIHQHHLTLNTLVQGAVALLLARYSGESEVVFGITTSGRQVPVVGIEQMLGVFINTLPLRVQLENKTILNVLQTILQQQQKDNQYAYSSLADIQSWSEVPNGVALFETLVVFENYPVDEKLKKDNLPADSLQLTEVKGIEYTNYPLTLTVVPVDTLHFQLTYDSNRFSLVNMERLLTHLSLLLEGLVTNPTHVWHQLPLLTKEEQQQFITWNQTAINYPSDQTMVDLFQAQVEKTPDNIAVIFEDQQLTYFELNSKANQLAHYLMNLGITTETLVGICVQRSLEMVMGLLGIQKSGGAYVPLDPDYPASRLQFILEDSKTPVLLTQNHLLAQLPVSQARVICIDDEWGQITIYPNQNPKRQSSPKNLAYIIYTSGSTGKPKGVMIEHVSLLNHMLWMQNTFALSAQDRVLQKTSFTFDASVCEFYAPLMVGGTLLVAKPKGHQEPTYLVKTIQKYNVTALFIVPSLLKMLLKVSDFNKNNSLRYLICGAETLTNQLRETFYNTNLDIPLYNLYGPTETTIDSTYWRCEKNQPITIGRPIANTQIYILDTYHHLTPLGVPGELCIAGSGLARGYLNRPELTSAKFIEIELLGRQQRLYKTGDLARWLPDGHLEYLGRLDHQVKLRGFRIELGEIEATLIQHKAIIDAVVVLYDQKNNPRLVAYVTLSEKLKVKSEKLMSIEESSLFTELRQWLYESLPEYMIPAHFMVLEKLPLMSNGKIDYHALPKPEQTRSEVANSYVMPQTEAEQKIAQVWQQVLQLEKVGIYDNFFDLGGHSLLIMQVHSKLQILFKKSLSMVDLFQYPTIEALAKHLTQVEDKKPSEVLKTTSKLSDNIAIVGMAGRFPGAKDIETFWQNLCEGVESITFFSDEELLAEGIAPSVLNNPNYVKANSIVENIELFDATFFGYSPKEAEIMDPQQRLFLECAWEAIENAGYDMDRFKGRIGVYAGNGISSYLLNNIFPHTTLRETVDNYQLMIANGQEHLATRTSYKLNLKGPAVSVQTACSTSLVAVHLACQSLLSGECDMALAGGVTIVIPQKVGYLYQPEMIISPDGHCRAFDAKAQGTVGGSGVGIVALKRLEQAIADGDNIYAVIKNSAINNDGADKVGYTAPSVNGQAAVITEAMADIDYESISYIETHGTGTTLGDPIEMAALIQAYLAHTQKTEFCAIASVKTNVGHLDTAAGVTGLIKAALALKHKKLPPSLHFEQPNPKIDFANSPFFVNTQLSEWQSNDNTPLRAGVSSFGIGGTNAHVVLEEAPVINEPSSVSNDQLSNHLQNDKSWQLLVLSAKTPSALEKAATHLADYLKQHPERNLADVAYTLSLGRKVFEHRSLLVCQTVEDAIDVLSTHECLLTQKQQHHKQPVVFLFSGQGSQYLNMALALYQDETIFREQVDKCADILKPHLKLDLREILYPSTEQISDAAQQLEQTALTQPALFVIEYALAQLWMAWGIHPVAMIGHSIGEYVAACLAGVFSLEEALTLVAVRAQLMQSLPKGAMLSVSLPENSIRELLTQELSLAAHNGPSQCVISGTIDAITTLENQLKAKQVECIRLHTSHAFHSAMMTPILTAYAKQVREIRANQSIRAPQIPYLSNVSGTWITMEQVADPDYWVKHLSQTVRFSEGLQALFTQPEYVLLEVGPGRTLTTLAQHHPNKKAEQVTLYSLRHPKDEQADMPFLLTTLGKLWLAGVSINWQDFYAKQHRQRLPLPTYPFERQRYWVEPQTSEIAIPQVSKLNKKPDIAEWFYLPRWKSAIPLTLHKASKEWTPSCWLVFIDSGDLGIQLAKKLEQLNQEVIRVSAGDKWVQLSENEYTLNPENREDYEVLLQTLHTLNKMPQTIVHLWTITADNDKALNTEALKRVQALGFYSVLFLAQALVTVSDEYQLMVVSNNLQTVTGEERLQPGKSTLLGPIKVIGQEYPNINCRSIDIVMPPASTDIEQKLIAPLLVELTTSSTEQIVAYRGQHRWIPTFEAVKLEKPVNQETPLQLREGGIYLITGGLGKIGLVLASALAKTVQAKLILMGRSPFPSHNEWEEWLATHEPSDAISHKIKQLQALETQGAEVLVLSADVANLQQMQSVIVQIEKRFGQLNGVIHAAGITGETTFCALENVNKAYCEQQFQPKIYGTLVLEEILQNKDLDFCLLMSSLSSVLGGLGFTAYSAANAFMDAFTNGHYLKNTVPWFSVNWDGWLFESDATLNTQVGQNITELAINATEGVEAIERILSCHPMSQLVVSTGNLQMRIEQWIASVSKLQIDPTKDSSQRHSRPNLSTPYVKPHSQLEQTLVDIWQELLGIQPIGIHDDFFKLGGDSLIGTRVISQVHKICQVSLPMHVFFEQPTVAGIASYLEQTRLTDQDLATQPHETTSKFVEGEL
ncbi:amino acid adenylation domain-containing protein [Candidatus Parabeggiatoa sp. HSG14]|uniref:non-ribosomal peptide synthetase/type I polyketide synthase n=1 Tax=Candidatus Parabeggiatoa sp. HSG14 TaxID=3055593 RepID=UPI0025A7BEF7|nr:amino acid adenylation domain-containing protein [Thiotrichales bacterium HSG14]